jgi:TonB family protein
VENVRKLEKRRIHHPRLMGGICARLWRIQGKRAFMQRICLLGLMAVAICGRIGIAQDATPPILNIPPLPEPGSPPLVAVPQVNLLNLGNLQASRVSPPTVIQRVEAQYSEEARRLGYEGTVVLEAVIRKDGTVDIRRVVRGLGLGLDENAVAALKQWRFRPGMTDGQPVDVSINIEVNFRLPVSERKGQVDLPLPIPREKAEVLTFREFVKDCRSQDSTFSYGICIGYIAGVSDWVPGLLRETHRSGICIPSGVTFGDLAKVIVKYGDDHPQRLYVDRGSGVLLALRDTFPCQPESK